MRYIRNSAIILLVLTLLWGCAQAPSGGDSSPGSITLGNSYVIAVDGDDTAYQAAVCLQTTLDRKMRMTALPIVSEAPQQKAIVLKADSGLEAGAYEFSIRGTCLHITASDSQTLLYAVKQLRQAMLDGGKSPQVTEQMCTALSGKTEQLPFTFISQNILYKNIEGGNTVAERAPRFKTLVQEYQPDILAIQENSEDWIFHYKKDFKDTYFSINQNNVTILLRAERYELVDKGFFWLSPTPEMKSQFEGDSGPRTCCWAIVKDNTSGRELFICNAHLDWNNDTQRALQLEVLIEQLSPYFEQYPTIACGDYNSTPDGPIYARACQLLTDSRVSAAKDISTVDHTCHSFGKSASVIDYIFHNGSLQADLYYILSDHYDGYVSDHYGVLTDFRFTD